MSRSFIYLSLGAIALAGTLGSAEARTWRIFPDGSGDAPTIQAGLDSAQAGDTVLVAAGEYQERLDWPSRNGIVLSGAGVESTLVVGDKVDTMLTMRGAFIDSSTVVRRLRFRNGGGAGIVFDAASAVLESCAVDSTRTGPAISCLNHSAAKITGSKILNNRRGGIKIDDCDARLRVTGNTLHENWNWPGIYCLSSSPTLVGNTIGRNISGAAINCSASSPLIAGNTISTSHRGIACENGSCPTIRDNWIRNNTIWEGGGIACYASNPEIAGNRILENTAFEGGGIFCSGCAPRIVGNWIEGNIAEIDYGSRGGGIFCTNASPLIEGNVIIRNSAGFSSGGGIACVQSSPMITGNVITENEAPFGDGGGIAIYSSSSPVVSYNSIVRNSARAHGGAVYCSSSGPVFPGNTITENSCRFYGDAFYVNGTPTIAGCNIAHNGWGIDTGAGSVPEAENNWWGDPSGPWHEIENPGGLGDSLSYWARDFVPWLACADTSAPPLPPRNLRAEARPDGSILLEWDAVPLADLAGYRVHFDTEDTRVPYEDSVDVGNATTFVLEGLVSGTKYYVAVVSYDNGGNRSWYSASDSATAEISTGTETSTMSMAYHFGPNTPNPFNPTTTIRFSVPVAGPISVTVHDIAGRRVATIATGIRQPGEHTAVWDGRDDSGREAPSGIYFARLHAGEYGAVRKMVLLK
jgi:hypothetical protein